MPLGVSLATFGSSFTRLVTSGPACVQSQPAARWAAAGENTSRPWNVDETRSPIIHSRFVISRAPASPSRSITGVMSPLSGSTKYCPRWLLTRSALRAVPTPGSTTTRNTVPAA